MSTTLLRVAGVVPESVVDGPGLRATLFVQGCPHQCPGCHNPETWDPEQGERLSVAEILQRMRLNPLITGVTFSGGEPFLQSELLVPLAKTIRTQGMSLWIYTGYPWEYLLNGPNAKSFQELIHLADVIVDGPFIAARAEHSFPYRGSSNQRLIDVECTLAKGQVVEWEIPRWAG